MNSLARPFIFQRMNKLKKEPTEQPRNMQIYMDKYDLKYLDIYQDKCPDKYRAYRSRTDYFQSDSE